MLIALATRPASLPFALVVAALQQISATRAGITAMLEPVMAIVVAWAWLGESLNAVQLSGAAVTLAGVSLALSSR
jgi:drug/metabolite transporter (DMT)-like permease